MGVNPTLVWDGGRCYITLGGLETWDVTEDALEFAVTRGLGTCKNISKDGFKCSECGDSWLGGFNLGPIAFKCCPSCGREVTK